MTRDELPTSDLTLRIRNWARWAGGHFGSVGHCASIEHRYRSPQHWWPEQPKTEVDLFDAVVVEKAIRALDLRHQKVFVIFWTWFGGKRDFMGEVPAEVAATISRVLARAYKLGVNRNRVGEVVAEAQNMVSNRLTAPNSGSTIPTTIRESRVKLA